MSCLALQGMAQSPLRIVEGQTIAIPLLTPAQMSSSDASVAAANQASVSRSAQIYGYDLDPSWSYRQIACPVAPKHVILAYESIGPRGVASRFTAIVRRESEQGMVAPRGGAEIIPIVHFGVVPFIPVYANPHTFEVFNRIVPSARPVPSSLSGDDPLLVRSLCFTAMIGEPPTLIRSPSLDKATLRAPVPTVLFLENRIVKTRFSVRNSEAGYQVWTLTFSSTGKLIVANKEEHPPDTMAPAFNAATTQTPNPETDPLGTNSTISPTAPEASELRTRSMIVPPAAVDAPPSAPPPSTPSGASSSATENGRDLAQSPPPSAAVPPAARSASPVRPSQAAKAPLPPRRIVTDLPLPPHRIIPDSSMSYPPQSPTPH
jgi:hypothetical protein